MNAFVCHVPGMTQNCLAVTYKPKKFYFGKDEIKNG